MKKILIATLLSTVSAWAAPTPKEPVRLDFEIDNGGVKSNATIIAVEGEKARIESVDAKNQPYFVEVVPMIEKSSRSPKRVEVAIKVVVKTLTNGEMNAKSINSRILTTAGKTASLGGTNDGKNNFAITVKPLLMAENATDFYDGCFYAGTIYPEGASLKQVDTYKKCVHDSEGFSWINK